MFELIIVNENNKKILENLLEYYLYYFNIYIVYFSIVI